MKNKKLIRIFALALALLLCLSLLPMAALAAEGEEDAQEFVFETPDDGDGDATPGEGDEMPEESGLGGSQDETLFAEDITPDADENDDPPPASLEVGSFLIGLLSYDEDGEPVNTEAHEAEVGDVLVAMITGCNNSGTLSYQWHREYGNPIPGATDSSYTVTEDDAGKMLWVVISSSVEIGTVSSQHGCEIAELPDKLSGTLTLSPSAVKVGETIQATLQAGTTGTLSYIWMRDGAVIAGASGDSYVTTAEDEGKTITCKVTSDAETGEITCAQGVTVSAAAANKITFSLLVEGPGTVTRDGTAITSGDYEAEVDVMLVLDLHPEDGCVAVIGTKGPGQSEYMGNLPSPSNRFTTIPSADRDGMGIRVRFEPSSPGVSSDGSLVGDDAALKIQAIAKDSGDAKYCYTDITPCWDNNPSKPMTAAEVEAAGGVSFPLGLPEGTNTQDYTFSVYHYKDGAWTQLSADQFIVREGNPGNIEVKNFKDFSPFAVVANEKPATGTITIYRTADTSGEKIIVEPELGKEYTLTAYTFKDGDFEEFNTASDGSGKTYKKGDKITLTEENSALMLFVIEPAAALTGTVTLSGSAVVGETLTAMVSGSNNTGTLAYQWKRDGKDIEGATASTYELTSADAGKKISCVVTSSKETGSLTSAAVIARVPAVITVTFTGGKVLFADKELKSGDTITVPAGATAAFTFDPDAAVTSVKQDGIEVGKKGGYLFDKDGKIDVTFAAVTLGGKAILDQTLTTSVTGVPEGKTPVYRWTRDGEDIEGADKASYTLTDADAGKAIRCVVTDEEKSFTAVSDPVTPAARPAAPTGVTVQQHITNDADASLGGHIGRITGLNSTMQVAVSAEGPWSTVPSTSGSFTTKNPYTYYIRYKATDSAPASQPLTLEVKNFVTAVKALSSAEAKKYKYDITLSEKDRQGVLTPATTDPGEAVAFLIPYPTGVSRNSNYLTLVHDTDGKNIEITQQDNGILGKSESFSSFTLTVGDMAPLTGTVSITGDPYVGETLTAELKDTNNTGVLSYQWTRDGVNIAGATATKYALTNDDLGKKIACVVTSSAQPGSVKSAELTVQATAIKVTQLLINDGDPEIPISQPARIIGVTTDMEFSLNGGAWMPVDAVPFDVTLPGTYTFRDKTTKAEVGSAKVTAYYTIWVSIKGTGGTVTARATGGTLIPFPEVDENTWLIERGDTVTLTFLPYRTTHTVTYLTVDGTAVTRSKTLQLRGVQKPHVIVVTFGDSRSSPRTGDTSNLGLWSALGMTSLAALAAIFVLQKRRRDA